jgi:hypothetical protein
MSHSFVQDVSTIGSSRSSSYVDTYANQIRLSANLSDLALVFGVIEDAGLGQMINSDRVSVRLSLPTAKALMLNLKVAIESYEKNVEQIKLPPIAYGALENLRSGLEATFFQMLNAPPLAASGKDNT